MRASRSLSAFLVVFLSAGEEAKSLGSPQLVTLLATTSPAAGVPGVTNLSVTGSNFPAGTIVPASVTIGITPVVGGNKVTTAATAVTTVVGTTRRVTFVIPVSVSVSAPTMYKVTISGITTTGTAFQSSNSASLTVNPAASSSTLAPSSGQQGQTLLVSITGQFTNFVQGATQAGFGAGISVGGGAAGAFGPVTVMNATNATASVAIASTAALGLRSVTVQTGAQQLVVTGGFTVTPGTPAITQISPNSGQAGQTLRGVVISGAFTHFTEAAPVVTFSNTGIIASTVQVTDDTHLSVTLTITSGAAIGSSNITVVTGPETSAGTGLFSVTAGTPIITLVNPNSGHPGQPNLLVAITAQFTHFAQGITVASFGAGITVNSTTVTDTTHATANLTIAASAITGTRTVTLTTGSEVASLGNGFTVSGSGTPTITDFNPKSAPIGALITVTGTNLQPNPGTAAKVTLAMQGGGTIAGAVSTTAATSLAFVVPAGAASGPVGVTVNGGSVNTATALKIVPASSYSLSAAPGSADLIQGQSTAYAVSLTSSSGFNQLAVLSVTGVPAGVTAAFKPQQITAGQTSILSLAAPVGQPIATTTLTVSASATVDGIAVVQSATLALNVKPVTTSFLGRTVVSDSLETPLAGVTITMLGKDGNGDTTGCTGSTVSDGGGNFLLANLPTTCVGPNLVGFNGTTVTSPPGKYAGVNLVFTFTAGQVTASPVLVHLPRIDNVETFLVTQNSSADQTHAFSSIPGLSVTVYAGTTFTMPDGTRPNPFPLAAVQVPVDRLPDAKPQVPTMIRAFIVAFQPANATTNEPVAVYFPNTLNTPPGTDMALMTLDPTHGQMVPYGTGAVASDGTQIVPDPDPAHPGHLYGLIHFDWHGPMPPPPPQSNPAPPGGGLGTGGPTSGPGGGPGGGSGPGGGNGGNNGGTGNGGFNGTGNGGAGGGGCCGCTSALTDSDPLKLLSEPTAQAGDPVDLFSGIQVITNTDISISGSRGSLSLVRTYRSLSSNPGPFGIGTGHNYSLQLNTGFVVRGTGGIIPIVMPDGNQFSFTLTGGSFTNSTIPVLSGAVLSNPSSGTYMLRWRNGTTYVFQTSASGGLEAFLTAIIDANGNKISLTLNPAQPLQITQITDPVGRSLTLNYDSSNRIISIIDPIGRTVQYTYNSQGTLATVTDPVGGITRYTYDANNNLVTITDPRKIVQMKNTFDSAGRVIQQVRPDGGTLTFTYVPLNPLAETSQVMQAQVTDSQGVQAIYRFNPNGFVTDVTATQGQTRHMARAPGTNLLMSVVESSSTQAYTYDANGNVLSSTDATGLTTQFTYDPVFNKMTSITDPLGNMTTFTYDANGNLTALADANGHSTSYQYDPTGLVLQSKDAKGQKTTFAYDVFGNLVSVKDPLGNTTSYGYDEISRLIDMTDAYGRKTSFTYDRAGRLLTRTDAKSGVTTFIYDADGNLLSVQDARGRTTSFTYDVMNRLASRTDPLVKSDTRSYDTNGNLVEFVDRRGIASTYSYDNLNRLISENYPDATVTRTYDILGRPILVNDSAAGEFVLSYDPTGRLTSSSTPFGTVNYTYDRRGVMASRQVVGQPSITYSYDRVANLISATIPQASASFVYDERNQISNISRSNGVSSAFEYDADSRLLAVNHGSGANALDVETYTYDPVGNRSGHSTGLAQPLTTQATANQYNAANQLTLFGSVPNMYDGNGNLVQEGTSTAYTWDSRNRLKSIVTAPGQTTSFTYDFVGNLIAQADSGSSLNLTKSFMLDDLTNVAYEAGSDGTSYSVLSGRSIDSHLAIVPSAGSVQYGLADAINSTVARVDQTGKVTSQFLYEPFGQTTTGGTYPFQFTGRVPVSTGLYYYRARFYNATTGRFISEDPLGSGNLYTYAGNSPVQASDPLGLLTLFLGGGGSFITGLGPQGSAGAYINFDHGINAGFYGSAGGGGGFDVGAGATGGFVVGPLSNFQNLTYNASLNLPVLGGGSAIISPGGQIIGGSLNGTANLPFPGISIAGQYTWTYSLTDLIYDTLRQILGPLTNPQNFCRFQP